MMKNQVIDLALASVAAFGAGYIVHELVNNAEEAKRQARRMARRTRRAGRRVKKLIITKINSFKKPVEEEPIEELFEEEIEATDLPAEEAVAEPTAQTTQEAEA